MLLTTHPLLVPRSWKSRAIPLPTLWATTGPVTVTLYVYFTKLPSTVLLLQESKRNLLTTNDFIKVKMIGDHFSRYKKKNWSHLTDRQEDPAQSLMKPKFYFLLRGRSVVSPVFNQASRRQDA